MTPHPTVLIVEDEPDLLELYTLWLRSDYGVRTALDAEAALEELDEDVDVVVLDRRMPGLSGDEFLASVRRQGYTCRVAVVSAVTPDFDILEMDFDEYVTKPVTADELQAAVARLAGRDADAAFLRELFALTSKKHILEGAKSDIQLESNDDYERLAGELDRLRRRLEAAGGLEDDVTGILRDIQS